MKIKFNHKTYIFLILDTEKLVPVNSLIANEYHKKYWDRYYLGNTVLFSHSNCMWSDDFRGYEAPKFIDLNVETINHEFEKLEYKYGKNFTVFDKESLVDTDLDFTEWYKENLAYKNKMECYER